MKLVDMTNMSLGGTRLGIYAWKHVCSRRDDKKIRGVNTRASRESLFWFNFTQKKNLRSIFPNEYFVEKSWTPIIFYILLFKSGYICCYLPKSKSFINIYMLWYLTTSSILINYLYLSQKLPNLIAFFFKGT